MFVQKLVVRHVVVLLGLLDHLDHHRLPLVRRRVTVGVAAVGQMHDIREVRQGEVGGDLGRGGYVLDGVAERCLRVPTRKVVVVVIVFRGRWRRDEERRHPPHHLNHAVLWGYHCYSDGRHSAQGLECFRIQLRARHIVALVVLWRGRGRGRRVEKEG